MHTDVLCAMSSDIPVPMSVPRAVNAMSHATLIMKLDGISGHNKSLYTLSDVINH